MSQPVTAEVVKLPEPERPELWVEVYREYYAAKPDEWWWEARLSETQQEADEFHARLPGGITIHVPASPAAPEPDWVAVLCGMGYAPQFSVNRDKTQYVCLAYADGTDPKCLFESATGPTPALAAKACVERLRAGGAT